jgi:phosphotransferase system HPr (HPr) family protein
MYRHLEQTVHAERDTIVGPEEGLHARPASEFVKRAKQFNSDIVVIKGDREANAKSPLKIMTLAAKKTTPSRSGPTGGTPRKR